MAAIPELALSLDGGALPSGVSGTDVHVGGNDGNVVVRVTNPTGSDVTVTLVSSASVAGHSVSGRQIVVPAGGERWIKPLPPVVYNDDLGDAHITNPSGELVFVGLRF